MGKLTQKGGEVKLSTFLNQSNGIKKKLSIENVNLHFFDYHSIVILT